ncbi:hypothetical protein K438DRAFT_1421262, partial [Mycena galopus ATCC 62051]
LSSNDFAGKTLDEINAFVREREDALIDMGASPRVWLVIDQRGLETSTWLVCQQFYDQEDVEEGYKAQFRACRILYEEAWNMAVRLLIGNVAAMFFEDFVDEDTEQSDDGSWRWRSKRPDTTE